MTRINPFQDVLNGIPIRTFLFCHTMYAQIGMMKNPCEYSSEFSHADTRLFQIGKKARTKHPKKTDTRINLDFDMNFDSSISKSLCSLIKIRFQILYCGGKRNYLSHTRDFESKRRSKGFDHLQTNRFVLSHFAIRKPKLTRLLCLKPLSIALAISRLPFRSAKT